MHAPASPVSKPVLGALRRGAGRENERGACLSVIAIFRRNRIIDADSRLQVTPDRKCGRGGRSRARQGPRTPAGDGACPPSRCVSRTARLDYERTSRGHDIATSSVFGLPFLLTFAAPSTSLGPTSPRRAKRARRASMGRRCHVATRRARCGRLCDGLRGVWRAETEFGIWLRGLRHFGVLSIIDDLKLILSQLLQKVILLYIRGNES